MIYLYDHPIALACIRFTGEKDGAGRRMAKFVKIIKYNRPFDFHEQPFPTLEKWVLGQISAPDEILKSIL